MLEMTLKLPESLTRLPEAERELVVRAGLHEATRDSCHATGSKVE